MGYIGLIIVFWIGFVNIGCSFGKILHVKHGLTTEQPCGDSINTDCSSLSQVLQTAAENDKIYIHSNERNKRWFCDQELPSIHVSVKIIGRSNGTRVHVGCEGANRIIMFNITNPNVSVIFQNLYFHQTFFLVSAGDVTFDNCIMNISKWYTIHSSQAVGFHFYNSTWFGTVDSDPHCTVNCIPEGYLELTCHSTTIDIIDSTFYQTLINVTASFQADITVLRTKFSSLSDLEPLHGGMFIIIQNETNNSTITVKDSIFESQMHVHPIDSIMNLYVGAFIVITARPRPHGPFSNITAIVDHSTFSNNERGLTFVGPYKSLNITNCFFYDNIAMHAGAGILHFVKAPVSNGERTYITNCIFENNAAGKFRAEMVENYHDSFQVSGDEVRIHSPCCKGVISFVGKGGAIRIQQGNVTITDCTFRNNSARLLGGAIFVDRPSDLILQGSVFENSPDDIHTLQGDILYSNGIVSIQSAQLNVITAQSHTAILRHSGNHWSIEVTDISIMCPTGYRLRVTNTSAYGVTPYGLRRSYKLDQLSYFCESCPRNKYSLDFGYLNYSLTYSSFDYDTLLINGNKPDYAYNGTYIYHDIECQQCPYGGKCQQGIVAVANFWGYIHENQVKFQHCPKGYCCSSTECNSYNTCGMHRQGRVCGECEDGYSAALFSSACVPDDQCDPTWLFPVALGSGILYTLFLLFQKDIRDLMYLKPADLHELTQCGKHRKDSPIQPVQNSVNIDTGFVPIESALDGFGTYEHTELETLKTSDIEKIPHYNNKNNNSKNNELRERKKLLLESEDAQESLSGNVEPEEPAAPPADTGASFLIILFYYFQDAQLLQIKTVFTSADNQTLEMLKEVLSGLFKFRVEVFQFMDKFCFLSGLTPTLKLLYKVTLVPYVLFQFGSMYIVYRWCQSLRHKNTRNKSPVHVDEGENEGPPPKTFSNRLATGFVLSLLFTYQMLARTSLTLLNCVPVGDENVLYIEGTVSCYESWQYGVMAYTASCIVPFCLALLIGPGLLKDGLISLPQFFCACLFPLPFLIYWLAIRLKLKGKRPKDVPELQPESQVVIQILQGPFKDAESKYLGPTCGAGVLIGRRLILILLFTFVNDTLIRMLYMMLLCFVILLHHVHVLPYKDTRCNVAGTVSAAALVIVGAINLVRAGFEAAEYIPLGPNAVLMTVFEILENVLMLWFPAVVMGLVILAIFLKIFLIFFQKMMHAKDTHTGVEVHANNWNNDRMGQTM